MSWQCYLIKYEHGLFFDDSGKLIQFADIRPGALWWDEDELVCRLPSGADWNMDRGRNINVELAEKIAPAWTREGEPPNVSAHPSINHVGHYHGWLTNGVLSDDCEGRTFSK